MLVRKALDAATDQGIEDILIGGGVAANSRLRAMADRAGRGAGHPGPGPATRAVHRQRRDGRRARRRARRPRPYAVVPRPAGRLVPADHRGRRLSGQAPGQRSAAAGREDERVRRTYAPGRRRRRRTPWSRPTRSRTSAHFPSWYDRRRARGCRPPTSPRVEGLGLLGGSCRSNSRSPLEVVHRDHAVADAVEVRRVRPGSAARRGRSDASWCACRSRSPGTHRRRGASSRCRSP